MLISHAFNQRIDRKNWFRSQRKKTYLAVVRAVTTSQKAWVEDHIHSFREKPLRYIVDGRGIARVYFVYNLTGVNQSISFMSITWREFDDLQFTSAYRDWDSLCATWYVRTNWFLKKEKKINTTTLARTFIILESLALQRTYSSPFSSKNSQELSLRLRNSPHHEIQCLDMICLDQK